MKVGTPREAKCLRISLSVPYQLKPLVAWPIRGRWTLAGNKKQNKQKKINKTTTKSILFLFTRNITVLCGASFFFFYIL